MAIETVKKTQKIEENDLRKQPVTLKEFVVVLLILLIDSSIAFHYYTVWGSHLVGFFATLAAFGYAVVAFGKSAMLRILYMWAVKSDMKESAMLKKGISPKFSGKKFFVICGVVLIAGQMLLEIPTATESMAINHKQAVADNNNIDQQIVNLNRQKTVELKQVDLLVDRAKSEESKAMLNAKKEKIVIKYDSMINRLHSNKAVLGTGKDLSVQAIMFGMFITLTSSALVIYHAMFIRSLVQLKAVVEENTILKTYDQSRDVSDDYADKQKPTTPPPAPPKTKPTPPPNNRSHEKTKSSKEPKPQPKPQPEKKVFEKKAKDYVTIDRNGQSVKVFENGLQSYVLLVNSKNKPLTRVTTGVFLPESSITMIAAGRAAFEKSLPEETSNIDDLCDVVEAWYKGDAKSFGGSDEKPRRSMKDKVVEAVNVKKGKKAICPACSTKFTKPQERSYYCGKDSCRNKIRKEGGNNGKKQVAA